MPLAARYDATTSHATIICAGWPLDACVRVAGKCLKADRPSESCRTTKGQWPAMMLNRNKYKTPPPAVRLFGCAPVALCDQRSGRPPARHPPPRSAPRLRGTSRWTRCAGWTPVRPSNGFGLHPCSASCADSFLLSVDVALARVNGPLRRHGPFVPTAVPDATRAFQCDLWAFYGYMPIARSSGSLRGAKKISLRVRARHWRGNSAGVTAAGETRGRSRNSTGVTPARAIR